MERSLFLARLLGPTFVAIAVGMLVNLGMYQTMIAEALHPGIVFYLSGLLSLLAGLAIVNLHNRWQADWRVIITVLGWLMTIGGIIRIVLPQVAIAVGSTIYSGPRLCHRGGADNRYAGRFPELQRLQAACLRPRIYWFESRFGGWPRLLLHQLRW